jgi:RNA polymerase sigma-70 factor (ECF subfamily)
MGTAHDRIGDLLERLRSGDDNSLGALFECYRRSLRHEIARDLAADPRLAARFDASDVVQEVFLDARQQLHGFLANVPHVDFWIWLRGLARERRLKFLRDHLDAQCRSAKRERALPDESWRQPAAPAESPSSAAGRAEENDRVRRALQGLAADDQDIIRLRVTEGYSNPEAAQMLRVTPAAVAKRLERALRRLKQAVAAMTASGSRERDQT